VGVGGEQTWR